MACPSPARVLEPGLAAELALLKRVSQHASRHGRFILIRAAFHLSNRGLRYQESLLDFGGPGLSTWEYDPVCGTDWVSRVLAPHFSTSTWVYDPECSMETA